MITISYFEAPNNINRFGTPGTWESIDPQRAMRIARQLAKTPEVVEVVVRHPEGEDSFRREGGYGGRWVKA